MLIFLKNNSNISKESGFKYFFAHALSSSFLIFFILIFMYVFKTTNFLILNYYFLFSNFFFKQYSLYIFNINFLISLGIYSLYIFFFLNFQYFLVIFE
jgi:NADH:ubiquinone oxidoreductase subunit 2 (subunit N)